MIDNLRQINVRGGGLPSAKFASPFLVNDTCDFGELHVLGCHKLEAGDVISGSVNQWSYFAALPAPVFGRFTNKTRAFFVPYTQIYKTYNDLLAGNRVAHAGDTSPREVKQVPLISNQDFTAFFLAHTIIPQAAPSSGSLASYVNELLSDEADTEHYRQRLDTTMYLAHIEPDNYQTDDEEWSHYDVVMTLSSLRGLCQIYPDYIGGIFEEGSLYDKVSSIVNSVYEDEEPENRLIAFNFTKYGKLCRNRLIALDYGFDLGYSFLDKQTFPAGMLFAATKAFMDWLVPTRYYNDDVFVRLREFISEASKERVFAEDYSLFSEGGDEGFSINYDIKHLDDFFILPFLSSIFFDDYFTTAFDDVVPNIVVPQPVMQEWHEIIARNEHVEKEGFDSNIVGMENYYDGSMITSPLVVSVGRLQSMINSARVGGTQIQEWLKNEFGITPSNDAMGLSTYLGCSKLNVVVGEVSATSAGTSPDGTGSKTGEFAGKAFISSEKQGGGFTIKDFEVKEAGYLIFTHELVAEPQYFNGLHNEAMEKKRYDFYNPRFDGVDYEPVYHRELANWGVNRHMAVRPQDYDRILDNAIFGLQPMYTRKKIRFDSVLGDFIVNSRNTGLECWYVARNFFDGALRSSLSQLNSWDYQFAIAGTVINDFDRIFYDQNSDFDHVKTYFTFNLHERRKMLPYKDSLDFSDGKDVKPSNQGTVS